MGGHRHGHVRQHPERFTFIIVFPQCRDGTFWAGEMMDQAIAALDQTVSEFNGDPNRLYLAGYSMGAFGTWQAGLAYPHKFAALIPIAGGIKPQGRVPEDQMAILSPAVRRAATAEDPYKAFAAGLGNTPVWVFHGGADDVVSPEGSRQIVEALKANGNPNVRYTEFENVGHGSAVSAFSEPELFEWLSKQSLSGQ
jgi:predicted peptidase